MSLLSPDILLRLILLFAAALVISCGTLQTPSYTTPAYKGIGSSNKGNSKYKSSAYSSSYVARGPLQLNSPVKEVRINRGYFHHRGKRPHKGIDLGGRRGDAILAAHSGVVVYAGRGFKGYGKMVLLEYDKNWATLYAHMSRFNVKTGDVVQAGDQIGDMGSTGRTTGVHLHFELIKNKQPVDPMPYLRLDRFLSGN